MAIVKLDGELDLEELESAEYEEFEYESYDGDLPPTGTVITGKLKKIWLSYTADDTPMLKVLTVADGDDDYYGLPVFDQVVLKKEAAFRYKPFLEVTGIALRDVLTKMNLADEDDNIGAPILSIGKWKPGGDIRLIVKKERYNGEWKVAVGKYLEPEEPNGHRPARAAAAKPAATRGRQQAEPEEEPEEEATAPARGRRVTTSRTTAPARSAKPADKPAARRGARQPKADKGYDEEPPF